ncbi:MAG: class I fructose-bisphosphate aldolase [Myxococcota bacterium]|nr:class I fructose-bisphosphate aldolase [Myxococcota bacterium]
MSNASRLAETAGMLVAPKQGILAADESTPTIGKRFAAINVDSTAESRIGYRDCLFSTTGLSEFISGVILFDETLRQESRSGLSVPEALLQAGILPGIKVDTGAKELAGCPGEKVTEGLDGLRDRLVEYAGMGARFAKWRAVITIGEGLPSDACVSVNAHGLARYAALCIENGLVPIVEPEVLMDGSHTIETCYEVSHRALTAVFAELQQQQVPVEQILLKPNMVLSGKDCPEQADVHTVASETIRCLRETVPAAMPGVVFLSGGQSDELATAHLNEMNRIGDIPWQLSFSYGRALQAPALAAWGGEESNEGAAQAALLKRARLNGLARSGDYSEDLEAA